MTMVKITTKRKGETWESYRAACDAKGLPYMTFYMRVAKLGWGVQRALNTPVRKYGKTSPIVVKVAA
jgi:hypothetical protein